MNYLLDTCAFIDMLFAPDKLSKSAISAIEGDNALFVSIASLWEIMIKQQIGKLNIDETSAQELQQICEGFGIEILQTEIDDIDLVRKLPIIKGHGDPFDRLIICQAQSRRLSVITTDRKFRLYSIDVIW